MRDKKHVVMLSGYEQRLIVRSLTEFRNNALRGGKPTEDVDGLILKVIDAPVMRTPRELRFRGEGRSSKVIELLAWSRAKDTEYAAAKNRGDDREAR